MHEDHSHLQDSRDRISESREGSSPPPPRKKQATRRLHTSGPYQGRFLNMAEARREIVTALKFHRASMKRASDQQKQQNKQLQQPPLRPPPEESIAPLVLDESHFGALMNSQQTSLLSPLYCSSPSWAYPKTSPMPISHNLNLPLTKQPLDLNLNFQCFTNVETPLFSYSIKTSTSSSSPTTVSSGTANELSVANLNRSDPTLHPAMGDEEMAEIRSIGEKHAMEWNDAVNLATSAWWSKLLKAVEVGDGENRDGDPFEVFSEEIKITSLAESWI